ncbi:hypothetical protein BDC45DRAFT_506922 [Circinella umbellata]|nr:hypothetical protein BDC45DRAFT_506922 [Circinella umbellata]
MNCPNLFLILIAYTMLWKQFLIICYNESNVCENCDFGVSLEPRVIKAITERSVDRTRVNCFYSLYH